MAAGWELGETRVNGEGNDSKTEWNQQFYGGFGRKWRCSAKVKNRLSSPVNQLKEQSRGKFKLQLLSWGKPILPKCYRPLFRNPSFGFHKSFNLFYFYFLYFFIKIYWIKNHFRAARATTYLDDHTPGFSWVWNLRDVLHIYSQDTAKGRVIGPGHSWDKQSWKNWM